MIIRPARLTDFDHLETFVWQAIFPAFDIDGLTPPQRAENDALVEKARITAVTALNHEQFGVFVAVDPKLRTLAGYIIADARPKAYAEVVQLIVKRSFHGKGVGELLLDEATEFIGRDRAVSLAVRHYNARAIAFFAKHGFDDTGETTGSHAIARSLMLREAFTAPVQESTTAVQEDSFGQDFPSAADEPVYEELPDYTLATDETPMFQTGANALRTEEVLAEEPEPTHLTEDQLSVLEAFIAKARAKKAGDVTVPSVAKHAPKPSVKAAAPEFDRSKIAFEVDYGEGEVKRAATNAQRVDDPAKPAVKPSFSFDFSPVEKTFAAVGEHVVAPTQTSVSEATAAPVGTESRTTAVDKNKQAAQANAAPAPAAKAKDTKSPDTKDCPDCSTTLPAAARFCYVCGMPQPVPAAAKAAPSPTLKLPDLSAEEGSAAPGVPEDQLELTELPPLPDEAVDETANTPVSDSAAGTEEKTTAEQKTASSAKSDIPSDTDQPKHSPGPLPVTIADLRKDYLRYFQDQVLAYFGDKKLKKYLERMDKDAAFLQVRDGSLNSLAQWLSAGPSADLARARRQNVFADLTEYFIVETAADLSNHVLPQRLLRHQSADWQTADLFKLVMDYLDFDAEAEVVHTDFVTMPARALKNATKSFLHAAKDERVFFICDQSLISQAKNGFAITDSGIYWKNVLQPAGSATFTTMREARLDHGHLVIDGQFFDAGGRLNLKVAVLLNKLRRMR